MKHIQKLALVLTLCLLLTALPLTRAYAAEGGSLWLRHLPADGGETISLVADAPVASGVITITYDTSVYTFQELTVDDAYVLAHAVNDQEAGTIKISWIGTGSGSGVHVLMRLRFAADFFVSGGHPSIDLSGSVQNANGEAFAFTSLDFGALNTAIHEANGLKAEDYTADSFAGLKTALDAALAQGEVETVTQAQLEEATQALTKALENLEVFVPTPPPTDPTEPTEPTQPTEPSQPTEPTEPAPTQPKPTDKPTQPGSQPKPTEPVVADPVPKGNDTLLIVGAALALCAVAAVAVVVILKKRGKK
jgi:hypothetical protein